MYNTFLILHCWPIIIDMNLVERIKNIRVVRSVSYTHLDVYKRQDGDGVPDYRDKELLTSQKCFPVNNDGIGTCPENACCKEIKEMVTNMPVSYTHLDVYKRQALYCLSNMNFKLLKLARNNFFC